MSAPALVRLRGLLHQDKSLAVLLPEAERLQELNQRLARNLPPALARLCRVGSLIDGIATVYCRHGAAASRVRHQAASLAQALSQEAWPVRQIKVRVRADWARAAPQPKPGLDQQGLDAWRDLADQLAEGPLKQAVGQLLRHHRNRP